MTRPLLYLFLFLTPLQLFSQEWNQLITKENPTFFDITEAFETYWREKPKERGTGYNVFKRWEWYWEQRVGKEGVFPSPMHDFNEWFKFSERLHRRTDFGGNWHPVGPTTTASGYYGLGRLNCIAFHPTDPNTFWVGSPSGGVWKTTNYGQTWVTTTDQNPVLGVSSIAVNPNYPDTLYAATGDGDRGSLHGMTGAPQGDNKSIGILLSADGGQTWQLTGLNWQQSEEKLIRKLIIHPTKPWILLCASSDGIWKTENSGVTWKRVTGGYFIDIEFMPGNPQVVYATTFVTSGGGNARLVRSVNEGDNFSLAYTVANGARIALGTTAANPALLHMLVAHNSGGRLEGIYESLDTGKTFTKILSSPNLLANTYNGSGTSGQGWYDLCYTISQTNANICYVGGINTWISKNRGKNWTLASFWSFSSQQNPGNAPVVHADKHHFMHHPLEPGTMFDLNDGGIYYTKNQGVSWVDISEGLNITQFYRFDISQQDTGIILGGSQDNGTRIRREGAWGEATGGDGMQCAIDPLNDNIMYSSYVRGVIYRNQNGFKENNFGTTTISNNVPGRPVGAWVTPFKHNPSVSGDLIAGYADVYRTTNYGNTWTRISTNLNNGALLRSIAIGNNNSDIIYAADYYGIYRTWNNGANWQKIVTISTPITMVEPHPDNDSILFYTHSAYNPALKVMKFDASEKGQNKATNLTKNLPNVAVNCLAILKGKENSLLVGTDIGIFYLENDSAEWVPFMEGLPNVVVTELKINYNANLVYAATFGRGVWKSQLFQNEGPPVLTSTGPYNSENDVAIDTTLHMKFNMPVLPKSGKIECFYASENTPFYSVSIFDSSVVFNSKDSSITLFLPQAMMHGREVNVRIPSGVIQGYNYVAFEGIKNREWQFFTIGKFEGQITKDNIKLFPNPTNGKFTVQCSDCPEKYSVNLYQMNGKWIQGYKDIEKEIEMTTQLLSPGIYLLVFEYQGQKIVERLMVY